MRRIWSLYCSDVLWGVVLRAMETSDYKEFIFKALIRKQDAFGSSEVQAGSVTGTSGELRATQATRLSRWLLLLN